MNQTIVLAGLVRSLESGRKDFVEAARGCTVRPVRGAWSVLECVEHVVLFEERYLRWIEEEGDAVASPRNEKREMALFMKIRSRLTKIEAPEVFWPQGRFKTLDAAVEGFEGVRGRTMEVVREKGECLYSIGVKHPFFGVVNGVELIQLVDGHARRHAEQIRELL